MPAEPIKPAELRFRQIEALTCVSGVYPRAALTEFTDAQVEAMVSAGLFVRCGGMLSMTELHWTHLYNRMAERDQRDREQAGRHRRPDEGV